MSGRSMVVDELQALMETPVPGDSRLFLERIEHALTDGYAEALALEGERLRIERRMAELAAALDLGDTGAKARELSSLAKRGTSLDTTLAPLRTQLSSPRARAR